MKYEEFAELMGFERKGSIFYKTIDGYNVYFKDYQFLTLTIPSIFIPLDKELSKEYIKKLTHSVDDNFCAMYGLNNKMNIAVVSLIEGSMLKEENRLKLEEEINLAINTLKADGYTPMTKCPFEDVETPYIGFGEDYVPVSRSVLDKTISNLEEKVNSASNKRSILSVVLSLIFASIGMLPALLLCIFNDYYFTGFAVLMPLGSVLGYYLSKAQSKKWLKLTTAIIGAVFILCFTSWSIPHMASARGLSLVKYMTYHKYQGIRKALFSLVLCYSGFGSVKMLDKKKVDYKRILDTFKNNI